MASGTRANPERGETLESGNDSQNAEVASENPVPDDDETRLSLLNDESQPGEDESTPALERIESILSKLAVAVERMKNGHAPHTSNQASAVPVGRDSPFPGQSNLEISSDEEFADGNHNGSSNDRVFDESGTGIRSRNVQTKNASTADYELYPTHIAYKIYQKGMQTIRCRRIGDGSFFIAKRSWNRLTKDFPTTDAGKKRLLPLAFDGDARLVYEEIAGVHPDSNCEEFWTMLGKRLCNDIHQSALRDRFLEMTWNEKRETFEKFAWRLRSTSLLLPEVVDDGLLLNRLKNGLPNRLQDQAKLVAGTFDEVVSRVSSLSSAQINRIEKVREVREEGIAKVGEDSNLLSANRFAHARCHYCQNLGHISRDCSKKISARRGPGKEQGYQQRPAGPNPKLN